MICMQGLYYSLCDKKDFVLQYVKQLENEKFAFAGVCRLTAQAGKLKRRFWSNEQRYII